MPHLILPVEVRIRWNNLGKLFYIGVAPSGALVFWLPFFATNMSPLRGFMNLPKIFKLCHINRRPRMGSNVNNCGWNPQHVNLIFSNPDKGWIVVEWESCEVVEWDDWKPEAGNRKRETGNRKNLSANYANWREFLLRKLGAGKIDSTSRSMDLPGNGSFFWIGSPCPILSCPLRSG